MNRRHFLTTLTAAAVAPRLSQAQFPATLTLTPAATPGPTIPADYVGLSYEAAQLANPAFFSTENKALISLIRGLAPTGNLRIGGGSSEFTTYSPNDPTGPPPFEVFGPDTSHTVKTGTVTTALALRNLRAFLDATGWNCLYGLNLGQGTKENAVAEASAACRILGPRLLALQIGNEPDSFRNRYRPATYGPEDFLREWNTFHDAILAAVPQARFAGPDISNKLPYLTAFAAEAPKHPDVVLLTGHYYAMGPAGRPEATIENLLSPDPKSATLKPAAFATIQEAMRTAHLPFRMSEGNSCWNGGQAGVSDTHASALWCADAMLRFAQWGCSGFNLHGGGNGIYAPIVGAPSTGFSRRPEYFGIQFAQHLTGASFTRVTLTGTPDTLTAYGFTRNGRTELALINKSASAVPLTLPGTPSGEALQLTGPSLAAQTGTTLTPTKLPLTRTQTISPATALLLTLKTG